MKKKLLLALLVVAILTCLFAITVNAANEVTVIGDSGTSTVDFETVFNLEDGYVAGFVNSEVYGKQNIQDVIFPATITGFNNSSKDLFKESTVLKTVTFEGTSVDMYDCSSMFYKSSIESLVFEQGHNCILNVRCYTKSVFADCTSLKTVKFPTFTKLNSDKTSDTGDALGQMFSGCTNMVAQNDIVFGEGVVSLGGQMIFANCSSLSNNAEGKCEVYFPSTIIAISHRSFQGAAITAIHLDDCTALESIGSNGGSEGTLSGTKLTSIDFSDCTSLNYLCSKVMGDNTLLTTVKGFENTKVTSLPTNAFTGCTALTSISFPNGITQIGEKAFYNCNALTGTYTFPNVTTIGTQAFGYAATNEGTNLALNFPSLVTLGGSSGNTHVFSYSGVTELTFGDDIAEMSFNTFTSCSRLWRVEFAGFAEGFTFPSYTFEACSALKAFSVPEGITSLPERMFRNCSSLTAVYLPSTLTAINSGDNDHATFKNCTNLYFVSEPFTYKTLEEIPTEPEVYYFPTGLTTMTGETFDGSRVNDVVVFPAGLTDLSDGYTFEGSKSASGTPTVVFLGDMETVKVTKWGVSAIYFCNKDDVDATTAGYTGSVTTYYCHAEGNTTHLLEKEVTTGATYIDNAKTEKLCFCGHAIETVEQENTALFNVKGYSKNGDSLVYVVVVNTTAIESYNVANEVSIKYGIVASQIYNDGDLISTEGKVKDNTVLGADFTGTDYSILQIKVTGAASYADTALHCCAYVTDGAEVAYLYESEGKATKGNKANQIKYNDISDE